MHDPADCLVSIQFAMRDALTAQSYANEDMSLDVSVASLYFACNRPTVAALMCFGQDIVYASAPPTPPPAATPDAHSAQLSTQLDESAGPPAQQGAKLARSGGEKRTVFRLGFCVAKLELQVAYEGYGERPFALCSVSDYDMQVHMHPESMFVTASLGNAQVQDGCLEEGNPYRQVCGLRSDTSASLIHTEFRCAVACSEVSSLLLHRQSRCISQDTTRDMRPARHAGCTARRSRSVSRARQMAARITPCRQRCKP